MPIFLSKYIEYLCLRMCTVYTFVNGKTLTNVLYVWCKSYIIEIKKCSLFCMCKEKSENVSFKLKLVQTRFFRPVVVGYLFIYCRLRRAELNSQLPHHPLCDCMRAACLVCSFCLRKKLSYIPAVATLSNRSLTQNRTMVTALSL